MRTIRRLALLLLLICASPAAAQTAAAGTQARDDLTERVSRLEADAALRERSAEAERRSQILEAKSQLEDKAYDRFAIIMAGLGVVITLLVVAFGIFTHRSAVSAARQEIADLKNKVQSLHDEAATAKQSAVEAAESARGAAEGAQAYRETAQEASEKVREAAALAERLKPALIGDERPQLTASERETVADAAKEVAEKPEREWTADEFKVKILQADEDENWPELLRLARGMEFLHSGDPAALSFALFQQGWAHGRLNQSDQASEAYGDLVERFADTDLPDIQRTICIALFNKGVRLEYAERIREAIATYDELVARYGDRDQPVFREQIAKALVNKGHRLAVGGSFEKAIAAYDDVLARLEGSEGLPFDRQAAMALVFKATSLKSIESFDSALAACDMLVQRFDERDEPELLEQLAKGSYVRARILARQKKVRACIAALAEWRERKGGFNCEDVVAEGDFKEIRHRPTFVAFLREQGCDV